MSNKGNLKLAVLIDADNAQALIIENLLKEIAKYGVASIKRAYGDFSSDHLKLWKEALNRYAITPILQFSYTSGKNATDAALIIDAMDILHQGNVDGFCIVSSDSDFTRLCTRIRESGLVVYGFGEKKTPEAFRVACNEFIFTENLRQKSTPALDVNKDKALKQQILNALNALSDDYGWAYLADIGNYIKKTNPEFDTRNYGFEKMSQLVKALKYIKITEDKQSSSYNKPLLIKINH